MKRSNFTLAIAIAAGILLVATCAAQQVEDAATTPILAPSVRTETAPLTEAIPAAEPNAQAAPENGPNLLDIPVFSASSDSIRFNFRGAPLNTVLDYLSQAAGVVVIRQTEVVGSVDAFSHQPLTRDEAVDLVCTLLYQKGYAGIRSGRTLTIVSRTDVARRAIPVKTGSDPEGIPANDEVVTQIIPVRYAAVRELVRDLTALMPADAVLTANEGSNALVMTASQITIQRMTRIIQALDTSIAQITKLKVFQLNHANSVDVAKVINDIFRARASASGASGSQQQRMREFFSRGGGEGGGPTAGGGPSEARAAQNLVVAVADERTNSLIVSASEDIMPMLEELVAEIDTVATEVTQIRVFPLRFATASVMAQSITSVFSPSTANQRTGGRTAATTTGGRFAFFGGMRGGNADQATQSARRLEEQTVVAVADERTNSVIVLASAASMEQIAQMVENLDSNPARQKKVHVYSLENADPETVNQILNQMFGGTNTRQTTTNRNTNNQNTNTGGTTRGTGTGGTGGTGTGGTGRTSGTGGTGR
jgi:general secretion pathway protein D